MAPKLLARSRGAVARPARRHGGGRGARPVGELVVAAAGGEQHVAQTLQVDGHGVAMQRPGPGRARGLVLALAGRVDARLYIHRGSQGDGDELVRRGGSGR